MPSNIGTWLSGWGGIAFLIVAIIVALRWPSKVVVALVLAGCLGVVCFREFAIVAVARAHISQRMEMGKMSPGYADGVRDMQQFAFHSSKFTLLAAIGCAAIAVVLFNKKPQ